MPFWLALPLSPEEETCLGVPFGLRQVLAENLASPWGGGYAERWGSGHILPHLPLLPPGKASSLAAGNGTASTLKVCLPQGLGTA